MTAEGVVLAERKSAIRALLREPLLTPASPESLATVRRHLAWLREFFMEHFGWMLHVERELVRLAKTPGDPWASNRAARPADGVPFSKRRYVVLCLALAAVERMDRQTTLQRIAEAVVALAANDPSLPNTGFVFALTGREERRELVAVIRTLLEMGVLRRVYGDEEAFVSAKGDALYRIERPVLARMINARRPPSTLAARDGDECISALVEELHVETEDARRRALRHRFARRLVDDPVIYYSDLSEEEREYLYRARVAIVKPIVEATGLVAEVRAEGIALVDPHRELTDVALPEEGTGGHVALLVAEFLATRLRSGDQCIPQAEIEQHVRSLTSVHGKYWRKSAREPGAEVQLTAEALEFLFALDLARRMPCGVEPRAAVARFALLPARVEKTE
jgi:uncharacterized protein (TIGR02678 family)